MSEINHPIDKGVNIRAKAPACPCSGKRWKEIEGTIVEVIHRHGLYWYRVSTGSAVQQSWVQEILP